MRMTATLSIAAAALLAAAPVAAQNTGEAANTTDMNAVGTPGATANETANAAAPVAVETNTTTAETMTTEPAAPAPEQQKSFPWGVVGLLGLLGLIPRARRGR